MHACTSTRHSLPSPTGLSHAAPSGDFRQQPVRAASTGNYLPLFSLLAFLLLTARFTQAQDVSTYQLAATPGTFVPLTGGATIGILAQANAVGPAIALPFTFYYGGTAYVSVTPTSRGYLSMNALTSVSTNSLNNLGGSSTFIAPLWDELNGTGGTASYVVTGTAPTRVFTFQWLNWRWGSNATAANISFQVKLYESTNVIQFVYQPEAGSFTSATASATIGLDGASTWAGDNSRYYNFVSLSDASASPTLVNNFAPNGASVNTINTRPSAGQTYSFTPLNDYCGHAIPLTYGSIVTGSTLDASMQGDPQTACTAGGTTGTPSAAAGVFYSLTGNGQTLTVSTCSGATATGGNTKLFIYSGSCGNFTCIGSNDDVLAGGCGTNPLASAVTFATRTGTTYYVFVQYATAGAAGPFGLRVTATGLATTAAFGTGVIEVFPNPATRTCTLKLPAVAGARVAHITLLNSLGQEVATQTLALQATGTQTALDVQTLPAGMYTVRVQAGTAIATRRLVVE